MTETQPADYQRTATISLDELTPFPGNSKRGDLQAILESLRHNAQYRGLVVREIDNGPLIVLAGNHTMRALQAHGAGDCGQRVKVNGVERPCGVCGNGPWDPAARCEVIRCDDATARRINLADNRTSDLGTYDEEALAQLLTDLDGDFDGTGYMPTDLEALLAQADEDDETPQTADELEPGEDVYREQYGVIVICGDEDEQQRIYEDLQGQGFNCRVVTT
ncbi:ParB/Srx family N-terminal domain-containing protein [Actinomadura opuntiae]|uniref:ParB/Srx family N-terminal domain-containing protein n=1 Tax=Actinomadura sp. OS1-43 TaxID=604315 RepID=UPI00255B253C|nr:ParB/Srx family N-terminal domain-containing protein [Actinomadura sp. OS1-43]MDL4812791.1 ParB/Srx family N-terminal domain-containing protein [Actinomadura sp. OS1-43]